MNCVLVFIMVDKLRLSLTAVGKICAKRWVEKINVNRLTHHFHGPVVLILNNNTFVKLKITTTCIFQFCGVVK